MSAVPDEIWVSFLDEDGDAYYYNVMTRESVRERPPLVFTEAEYAALVAANTPAAEAVVSPRRAHSSPLPGEDWQEVVAEDGATRYYYSATRDESRWEKPYKFRENSLEGRFQQQQHDRQTAADLEEHDKLLRDLAETRTERDALRLRVADLEAALARKSAEAISARQRAHDAEVKLAALAHTSDISSAAVPPLHDAGSVSDGNLVPAGAGFAARRLGMLSNIGRLVRPGVDEIVSPAAAVSRGRIFSFEAGESMSNSAGAVPISVPLPLAAPSDSMNSAGGTAPPVVAVAPTGLAAGVISASGITLSQLSFLKSVPLFHVFSEDKFLRLATKLRRVDFTEGAVIIRQGDAPDGYFYVIDLGRVQVHVKQPASASPVSTARSQRHLPLKEAGCVESFEMDDETDCADQAERAAVKALGPVVAELSKGMFFGERALMTSEPRAATCVAASAVSCYALDRKGFEEVLSSVPDFLGKYSQQHYRQETTETIALARHVHSYRMLMEAVQATGVPLDAAFDRDSLLPPARAVVDIMTLFSPEIAIDEMVGRLRRVLKSVLSCEYVEVLLYDTEASELLLPIATDAGGGLRSSATGVDAALVALGGRVAGGYARVRLASCGAAEYAIRKSVPVFSQHILSDPRFVSVPLPRSRSSSGASDSGAEPVRSWAEQQRLVDDVLGFAECLNSLAIVPVADGDGQVLAVLLVGNKFCPIAVGAAASAPAQSTGAAQTAVPLRQRRLTELRSWSIAKDSAVPCTCLDVAAPGDAPLSTDASAAGSAADALGGFSTRDEDVVCGTSEALSMALDDRRVELETIISSRDFTSLADVAGPFRVTLHSLLHVPLPGAKTTAAGTPLVKAAAPSEPTASPSSSSSSSSPDVARPSPVKVFVAARDKDVAKVHPLLRSKAARAMAAAGLGQSVDVPMAAVTSKVVGQIIVAVSLFHGSQVLSEVRADPNPLFAEVKRVAGAATWSTAAGCVIMSTSYSNLPFASRLIFNASYKDGTPIGWAGCSVFTAQQVLRSGTLVLPLWPGRLTPETIARITNLANTHAAPDSTPSLVVVLQPFPKTVVRIGSALRAVVKPLSAMSVAGAGTDPATADLVAARVSAADYSGVRERVLRIIRTDPLYRLTPEEAELLWQCREYLVAAPEALPKFLAAVRWDVAASVHEAHRLLHRWRPPSPLQALELLQSDFADPTVRAYAVSRLEMLGDAELHTFMLQLTQVLKFELFLDSSLARFLLRRALRRPRLIGHVLFWFLKAEMHILEVAERFGAILQQYLVNCGEHRTELGHQMFAMSKMEEIALKVKAAEGKAERLALLRAELPRVVFPERFQLPHNPHMVARGLMWDRCRVMNSKKLPLWLVFEACSDAPQVGADGKLRPLPPPSSKSISVLFKAGDDLRQDQLTLQILGVMDAFWKAEGLDLRMSPYRCVATGDELGMIEVVAHSSTLANIVAESIEGSSGFARKVRAALQVYSKDAVYKEWLEAQDGADVTAILDNFVRSCAGYCVATYVLGIGDRHNDNIMITQSGKLFHIDFGHFLGNFKSKFGYKRERAPFVFTPAFAAVMGGEGSDAYRRFEALACAAFNVLRRHGHLLITLLYLMMASGLPELHEAKDLAWLQEKLMLGASDEEAADHMRRRIKEALNTRATLFNDAVHLLKHA